MTHFALPKLNFSLDKKNSVSFEDYQEFKKIYDTWYKIGGLTFGQAFCHHFQIIDDMLDNKFVKHHYSRIYFLWLKKPDYLANKRI